MLKKMKDAPPSPNGEMSDEWPGGKPHSASHKRLEESKVGKDPSASPGVIQKFHESSPKRNKSDKQQGHAESPASCPFQSLDHSRQRSAKRAAALYQWEAWLCIMGWSGAVVYSCYNVYRVSVDLEESLNDYDFTESWSWVGKQKDISNPDWNFWSLWFVDILPWYVVHVALGQIMRWIGFRLRGPVFLFYSVLALSFLMGVKVVGVLVFYCLIAYLAAWLGSTVFTWIVCLLLLSTITSDPFSTWLKLACDNDPSERRYYLLVLTLAMTNLRFISFCVEWCDYRKKVKQALSTTQTNATMTQGKKMQSESESVSSCPEPIQFSFMDMFTYCFYFPLFFGGLLLTYNLFYQQFHSPLEAWKPRCLLGIMCDTLRVIFWAVFCEITLHFLYFNSIQHNVHLMETIPLWALAGVGYCHGQFFMVKYIVLFGLPRNLARFDQLDPPRGPVCIAHISRYSEMWKNFDRGFYSFKKRYIFIPLGGSQKGLVRQIFSSAACFLFVYFWHGAEDYLLWWVFANFIGITLELLAARLPDHLSKKNTWWSSPAMRRRLQGVLGVPLLAMSLLAIFTFFGGKQIGYIFYKRLIRDGWPVSILTIAVFLYCFVQTSIEVERWESKKKKTE